MLFTSKAEQKMMISGLKEMGPPWLLMGCQSPCSKILKLTGMKTLLDQTSWLKIQMLLPCADVAPLLP